MLWVYKTILPHTIQMVSTTCESADILDLNSMQLLAQDFKINPETNKIIQRIRAQAQHIQEPCEYVKHVMSQTRYATHSTEWHNVRGKLLTASDMAAVLGENPYQNEVSVFMKKTRQVQNPFTGNMATRWGQQHEEEAAQTYTRLTGMRTVDEDIGLMVHPYEKKGDLGRKRYAATPDRLAWSGVLIEIKCPFRRIIGHSIPVYYLAQLQCQLEITGCQSMHFVQYKPASLMTRGVFDIMEVERNPSWWNHHVPIFDRFWDTVIAFYEERNLEVGEKHMNTAQEVTPKPLKMSQHPMQIVLTR